MMSKNRNKFSASTEADIRDHGRTVICVFPDNPDDGEPSFAYTIGNFERHRLPELLAIGHAHPQRLGALLNDLSEIMIERKGFADRELVSLGGKYPVKISAADSRAQSDYTIQAGQHYGVETYPVLQVLLCDREGRYPGEAGCQPPFCDAPILRQALN
jgi:hypothetical protein